MSGDDVLLDSVLLIDHFNGISPATDYLSDVGTGARISAITRAEVLTGFDAESVHPAAQLLDRFELLAIDGTLADLAAALRREHGWRLPDALQAAAARHHDLTLATRNTRDFPPDAFDFVAIPYTLDS